jgi:hypothetical protein
MLISKRLWHLEFKSLVDLSNVLLIYCGYITDIQKEKNVVLFISWYNTPLLDACYYHPKGERNK